VSVYAALSLVATGSHERILSELLGVLGAPSRDDLASSVGALAGQALAERSKTGGPCVSFACAVVHDRTRPLKPAYIDAVVKDYKAQTCLVVWYRSMPINVVVGRGFRAPGICPSVIGWSSHW
jgi:hypothetical protein